MNVLVTDYAWPSLDRERAVLEEAGAEIVVAETGDEDELMHLARRCDAILTCWKPVTAAVLDAARRCRVVARYGVGLDNIDVDRATQLGIVVTNVPDYCVDEVAEHTVALMLALTRNVVRFALATRAGRWDNRVGRPLHRLSGQTMGLVGCGRIGTATAARARALGMRTLAFEPTRLELAAGIERAETLEDLLDQADVVTLHAPLTPQTTGMIGEAQLRRMKPTAFLINTSRGGIVDQDALTRALAERWIAGAGLDVLAHEPPDRTDPLLGLDNAIVTPHVSFSSEESTAELQRRAAVCVAAALGDERPPDVANPEVFDHPDLRLGRAVTP